MDVFYHYAGNLFFQLHIGEIPEAPYAVSGQEVHCFLRYAAGDGEHGHIGFALYHIVLKCIHGMNRDAVDFVAD